LLTAFILDAARIVEAQRCIRLELGQIPCIFAGPVPVLFPNRLDNLRARKIFEELEVQQNPRDLGQPDRRRGVGIHVPGAGQPSDEGIFVRKGARLSRIGGGNPIVSLMCQMIRSR